MTAILAHRGASADHPENTLRAIRRALLDPPTAAGFECDVRLSSDAVAMVFHDDETTRLTGQSGSIEARTVSELSDLQVSGEPIPTLSQLLAMIDTLATEPLLINVELKPTGHAGPLIAACRDDLDTLHHGPHALIVSSFDPRVIAAAFDAEVPWRLAFLYETLDALGFLAHLDTRGPLDLHPLHTLLDADHIARYEFSPFDGSRRAFRTWTVDDPDEAKRLVALEIDAIITNVPQPLAHSLRPPQTP
ncbi:MAG: glycerophosphodiester phosphodiesterase [Myxococcota bacterium]